LGFLRYGLKTLFKCPPKKDFQDRALLLLASFMQQFDALLDANPWQYSQRCLRMKEGDCQCTEKQHKLLQ